MTTVHIKIALATTATRLDLEADCGVCFKRFTSENAMALPCADAVCSTCVQGLSRTEQGLISCPYCRTGTRPDCIMPATAEAPARATSKFNVRLLVAKVLVINIHKKWCTRSRRHSRCVSSRTAREEEAPLALDHQGSPASRRHGAH